MGKNPKLFEQGQVFSVGKAVLIKKRKPMPK